MARRGASSSPRRSLPWPSRRTSVGTGWLPRVAVCSASATLISSDSSGGKHLKSAIVAIAGTPDGAGYWLFSAAGAVYRFGDARNFGAVPPRGLGSPIVSATATPDGLGYYLLSRDGQVFHFGDAARLGSASATMSPQKAVAIVQAGLPITLTNVAPSLRYSSLRYSSLRAVLEAELLRGR